MQSRLNRLVLVLNATFEAIGVVSARHAMKLVFKGRAVVQELSAYVIHTSQMDIPLPDVIRLVHYRRVPRISRSFSRRGLLLRDQYTCMYCGSQLPVGDLTMDHVLPQSRGGPTTWENVVTSCRPCNLRKADLTPQEAGMMLLKKPVQLNIHARNRLLRGDQAVWDKYLYV